MALLDTLFGPRTPYNPYDPAATQAPQPRNPFRNNSTALTMAGLGLLGGQDNPAAFRNAVSGLALGMQFDESRRERIEERQKRDAERNATMDYLRTMGGYGEDQLSAAQSSPAVRSAMLKQSFAAPKDRRIVQGADGFQYFADTGERVLPGVQSTDRKIMEDASGRQRYVDTGEYVFADVQQGPDVKGEGDLRKEYAKLRKDHDQAYQGYQKVLSAAKGGTAADDVALIFGYMKTLDPNSTVREGEFATAQQTAGIPGQIRNLYNQALSGQRLTDEQRQEFSRSAANQYNVYRTNMDRVNQQYGGLATQYGYDPSRVISPLQPFTMPQAGALGTGPRVIGVRPAGGQ